MMKKFLLTGMVVLTALLGACSVSSEPVYGPNEKVIYNDGDLVITSEKTVFSTENDKQSMSVKSVGSSANVWRISQEIRKYYRQGGTLYVSGQLLVTVGVKNIAYNKTVGIRYTKNNWSSFTDANGYWSYHVNDNNSDVFTVYSDSNIQPGTTVFYAVYYYVNGQSYWDNNNNSNYSAQF